MCSTKVFRVDASGPGLLYRFGVQCVFHYVVRSLACVEVSRCQVHPHPSAIRRCQVSTVLRVRVPTGIVGRSGVLVRPHVRVYGQFVRSRHVGVALLYVKSRSFRVFRYAYSLYLAVTFRCQGVSRGVSVYHAFASVRFRPPTVSFGPLIFLRVPGERLVFFH